MILQMEAKVDGLGNLGVSTYTYLSLSAFKATFCLIHSSRQDFRLGGKGTRFGKFGSLTLYISDFQQV